MKTFFYSAPNDSLKVSDSNSFDSLSLQEVFSFARKHVTNSIPYAIYLVITDIDSYGDTIFITKKLFEIYEKSILPIIINDYDIFGVPFKS